MESSNNKEWSWRKKAAGDVVVLAADRQRSNSVVNESVDAVNAVLVSNDKAAIEVELQSLKDKLLLAQSEIRAKDELVKKHAMFGQEAIAGWEKAESEALSIREALEIALHQCRVSEERCQHLDGALRECMQQLRFVGEQQEQRVHDVLLRAAGEFEKTKMSLEEKLLETGKRMSRLGVENARLSEALVLKDNMIQETRERMTVVEADCNLLRTRLDTTKKENASLKYEIRLLEKELEIRNEEREFNRRAADASHKKQLENVKKLTKLESECERLRVLVQKQLPLPVGLAQMKDKVGLLEKECVVDTLDTPNRRINSLTKELYALEEENSILKKTINYRVNELQMSKAMYVRTASRLSQVENLLEELSMLKDAEETTMNVLASQGQVMSVLSDIDRDDKFSYAESLASALNSEQGRQSGKGTNIMSMRPIGVSDMNLMDDFLEMEKLAVIYADKLVRNSPISPDVVNAISGPLDTESNGHLTEASGPEIIHISEAQSQSALMNQSVDTSADTVVVDSPDWLRGIIELILAQQHLTQRSHIDLLGEIQVAPESLFKSKASEFAAPTKCRNLCESPNSLHGNGSIPWPEFLSLKGSYDTSNNVENNTPGKSTRQIHPTLKDAVCKMIELLEGIHLKSPGHYGEEPFDGRFLTVNGSDIDTDYMVRVFQWKASELSHVIFHLVQTCSDLLNGKDDIEKFMVGLTSAFDWIMNHCFSIQDVSSMRDEIKQHLGWNDTRSECDTEVGSTSHLMEPTKFRFSRDQAYPKFTAFSGQNVLFEDSPREGSLKSKNDVLNAESAKKGLETKLQDALDQCKMLQHDLLKSEKTVLSLQKQLETLKESKRMAEDQTEKHMFANEELHSQLTEARVDLNETFQKIVSLEVELENKSAYCEDLEATCIELQLQLQSLVKKELPNDAANLERQLLKDWEFATASEKLAECQETILNLGRQLKAIASPREATLFDKAIISAPPHPTTTPINATTSSAPTTPIKKTLNRQRTSLLEKMLAEDKAHANAFSSPKTKEMTITSSNSNTPHPVPQLSTSVHIPNSTTHPLEKCSKQTVTIHRDDETVVKSLVLLQGRQSKKRGGWSLWRRLFRRRRGSSRKMSLSGATN